MAVARFLIKRISIGLLILLSVTFVVYLLISFAINPLDELATYNGPDKQIKIASLIRELDLNTPAPIRYFKWLGGILGFFWGAGTFGMSTQNNQPVLNELAHAIPTTINLVATAIICAIILGVIIGLITAVRQYSSFDYFITFISFFLYSLPAFWVAILLKQYGALGFNDFLKDPTIPIPVIAILSLGVAALFIMIVSSDLKQRLIWGGGAFAFTFALLLFCSLVGWFKTPGLTIFGVGVLGAAVVLGLWYISFGFDKKQLITPVIVLATFLVLYYPLQFAFRVATIWMILGLGVGAIAIGVVIGLIRGGDDRAVQMRNGGLGAFVIYLIIFVDRLMQAWAPFMRHPSINGRPVSTIGSMTPNLTGSFWILSLDSFTHIILPTLTLLLISFAGYTRYTRASMLDVLNADYIRTARAKGLPERSVIMRHAFKNALIPLATIIPLDIAAILGGAMITETIFGWKGMGRYFLQSLNASDFNGVMGVLLVTSSLAIAANIISDLLYVALDPRIRLES